MNKTLGFSILDLPGPSLYIGDILGFIDGGIASLTGIDFCVRQLMGKYI